MVRALIGIVLVLTCAGARAAELPAWIAGHWTTKNDKLTTEEVWLAPAANLMVGAGRTVGAKGAFFEFMRIEARGENLYFIAQPRGAPPTEFKSVKLEADTVVFENLQHDFPQRVIYRRAGADRLDARTEGMVKGKLEGQDWQYQRAQ